MLKEVIDRGNLPDRILPIYDHWTGLIRNGQLPEIGDFSARALKQAMAHSVLTEVVHGEDGSVQDFVFRLIGSFIAERMPQVYVGEHLSSLPEKGPGSQIWSAYEATATSGLPRLVTLPYVSSIGGHSRSDEVFLPLAKTGEARVGYILVGIYLD